MYSQTCVQRDRSKLKTAKRGRYKQVVAVQRQLCVQKQHGLDSNWSLMTGGRQHSFDNSCFFKRFYLLFLLFLISRTSVIVIRILQLLFTLLERAESRSARLLLLRNRPLLLRLQTSVHSHVETLSCRDRGALARGSAV